MKRLPKIAGLLFLISASANASMPAFDAWNRKADDSELVLLSGSADQQYLYFREIKDPSGAKDIRLSTFEVSSVEENESGLLLRGEVKVTGHLDWVSKPFEAQIRFDGASTVKILGEGNALLAEFALPKSRKN